jgi:Carboxypeptidase regulatory-like domain
VNRFGRSVLLLAVACLFTARISAQVPDGVVRGEVIDGSDGVLPGVTVIAATLDGQVVGNTVTDHVGRYVLHALPPGPLKLRFELDGFETGSVSIIVQRGVESRLVARMKLAHMKEEVIVVGKAPAPPLPRVPEPPPLPPVVPVDPRELETVCRPARPGNTLGPFGTIQSHRYAEGRMLYSKGDALVVNGGTDNGLLVGQNLIVTRYFRANSRGAQWPEMGEHTSGLVQIVAADEHSATAIVVHACNELMQGDLLMSFRPEYVVTADPGGTPVYEEAAKILFADDGQLLGAPRRLLVIDRGHDQGVQAGQRMTLFRRKNAEARPSVIGEAVVMSVRTYSSTIRVLAASDAIEFGDFAAPQRTPIAKAPGRQFKVQSSKFKVSSKVVKF